MRKFSTSLLAASGVLALLAGAAGPVAAGSLGASSAAGGSSASSAGSASSEASSDSSGASSKGGGQRQAAGPYRIVDVAAVPDRPGQARLYLQALAADAPEPQHELVLPLAVVAQHRLAAGQTVTARPQPYGTEFVHDASREAFFLVLGKAWSRELDARPVKS